MKYLIIICASFLFLTGSLQAQEKYAEIDALIADLYGVISGPAGERDWDKFKSLFTENAIMGAMRADSDGQMVYAPMSPSSYVERNGPFFLKNSFVEHEVGRQVQQFGELAHVYSAYEFNVTRVDGSTASQRGINSIQLVMEEGRWWIVSIQWNSERDDNPIPKKLQKMKQR